MKEIHFSSLLSLIAIRFIATTIRLFLFTAGCAVKSCQKKQKSADVKSIMCHYSDRSMQVIGFGNDDRNDQMGLNVLSTP